MRKGIDLFCAHSEVNFVIFSLKASIHVRRPELLPAGQKIRATPIQLTAPAMYFSRMSLSLSISNKSNRPVVNIIPQIGEMMLAQFALSTQFDGENW